MLSLDSIAIIAQAAPAPAQGSAMSSGAFNLLFIGLMFAAMWFLIIAPQRKKQKEHEKMLKALGVGDGILTTGGIYGTITNVKEDRFTVRIADDTKIELNKAFIHAVDKKS